MGLVSKVTTDKETSDTSSLSLLISPHLHFFDGYPCSPRDSLTQKRIEKV